MLSTAAENILGADNRGTSLPPLRADLLLIHAPAFFDFRNRRDIYFPFLGTSGDVPITPLYEYFPVGFKTLQRFLTDREYHVRLLNLSTLLLRYPALNFDSIVQAFDVKLIGIDLHWMVHVQGSLAVAERIKEIDAEVPIVFGGISSTYYAEELIRYPFIDFVLRGYDTHEPMAGLLTALKTGGSLRSIPNLLWKSRGGEIRDNGFDHTPNTFGCGIDWSTRPDGEDGRKPQIREFLSTQNAGCAYNCGWCGGSREAFRRIFKRKRTMARKPRAEIAFEFDTMKSIPGVEHYHFYSVGSYNEPRSGMEFFLDRVSESNFKSISFEQYFLTPADILKRMAQANRRTSITLSPESHDLRISRLSGRGTYTNEELERWLEQAFDFGIAQVDVWYFIGMPEQDEQSVVDTVAYCEHLLRHFEGKRVNPMICPMIPFLDPASTFFEFPEQHGYRVFHRTVEEHRRAMERASLIHRINYETRWLTRADLVRVGFQAVKRLMELKAEVGVLPPSWVKDYNAKVDDALEFISVVHDADSIGDSRERARRLETLGEDILRRNEMIFFSGVMNQAFPANRQIGGRWFDEMGWETEVLDASLALAL